jgi:hypothetical protein
MVGVLYGHSLRPYACRIGTPLLAEGDRLGAQSMSLDIVSFFLCTFRTEATPWLGNPMYSQTATGNVKFFLRSDEARSRASNDNYSARKMCVALHNGRNRV